MLMCQFHQSFGIGLGTGGSFGMHESHQFGIGIGPERLLQFVRINHAAPFIFQHDRCRTTALDVFLHAPAEHAVLADDHLVTRLDQVDEAGFHAGRTRCRNRKRQFVFGLKGVLQQRFHLFHHSDKGRIEMANGGPRQRFEYARTDIGRTRPHQGPPGRDE